MILLPRFGRFWLALCTSLGLLAGCTSEEQDATLRQLAKSLDASVSYNVGYVRTNAKNKESGKYLAVTIKNPGDITPDNHGDLGFSAAKFAYLLYRPDLQQGSSSYDFIRIIFDLDSEKSTFEYSYPTIRRYSRQYSRVNKLLRSLHSKAFHAEYFNTSHITDADAHRIQTILRGIHADSLALIGFREGEFQHKPALVIKAMTLERKSRRLLTITTDFDSTSAPIIGFTLGAPLK